jgi:hypothetical protein
MPWHDVTERAMAALGRAGADQYLSGFSIYTMQRPESTKVWALTCGPKHVRFLLRRMSTQEALALLLPAPSNTVVINARCSLRIEADQRVIVVAGLPVHHYRAEDLVAEAYARPRALLIAENLCLREQSVVLQRHDPRPHLSNADRRFDITRC